MLLHERLELESEMERLYYNMAVACSVKGNTSLAKGRQGVRKILETMHGDVIANENDLTISLKSSPSFQAAYWAIVHHAKAIGTNALDFIDSCNETSKWGDE